MNIPDLEEWAVQPQYSRTLFDYVAPNLIAREMAVRPSSSLENIELLAQVHSWKCQHWNDRGLVRNSRGGFSFGKDNRYQLIPDVSYISESTLRALSSSERNRAYVRCVPTVVIELASETDKISALKEKISIFMKHGTREGLLVDTRKNKMWIFNGRNRPETCNLGVVIFDYWPEFELDCVSIKKFRENSKY
jgi:Uma2 family endonuclease